MTPRLSKLLVAAALASALPAAALARDCRPVARVAVAYAPPAPAPAPRAWRDGRWREREIAELRAEFRALEQERARFYAVNGHRPGKIRKFERRYAARRAELESRWNAVHALAWR